MKNLFLLLLTIILIPRVSGQRFLPEVVFQSGFTSVTNTYFSFSPGKHYLVGANDLGEYIVWDTQSGKQIKKTTPVVTGVPEFMYLPHPAFSNNERFMLIPDYPKGNYILYDLVANRTINVFKPDDQAEKYTHAMFSANGELIIIIGQRPGEAHSCELLIYGKNGDLRRRSLLDLPLPVFQNSFLLKILMGRALRSLNSMGALMSFTISDKLDRLYAGIFDGKVYELDLNNHSAFYTKAEFRPIRGVTAESSVASISIYHDKLIISGMGYYRKIDSLSTEIRDTLYVVNPNNLALEKKACSRYLGLNLNLRSNAQATAPITSNQVNNVVFDYVNTGPHDFDIIGKDVLSGKELFRYKKGDPFFFQTTGSYRPGQLNGGYIVAVSPDQQYMAECTREIIIHQVQKKQIKSVISAARGQLKLGAPLFLDSTRVLIPKTYNDGFVLNVGTGIVDRLKREIDCQDTAHNGGNVYFPYDNTMQIGLQNSAMLPGNKQFMLANIVPNDLCNAERDKEITVWDSKTLLKKADYLFKDREFTYFLSGIEGYPRRFLINYKLVDFENNNTPKVVPLIIKQKRDTFYAVNPVFLPNKNQIFSITGTRTKPGNPEIIFATWDVNGKLIKSYPYRRSKTKFEYQTLIYESQLSPDSSKLLFCLYDGTVGIFDLEKMEVTSTYEHGQSFENSLLQVHVHNNISAGCFIDNDHFVTNGDNNLIYLWTIGKNKPDRIINKVPLYLLSLTISPDKKYLVGTSIDKTVHFINLKTGISDVNFVASNQDAYTIIDKDGFYISNKKSNNDISFFYQGQGYEFAQFDLSLHRPDKVLETLGYAGADEIFYLKKAWEKRVQRLNYHLIDFNKLDNYAVPVIELRGLNDVVNETKLATVSFQVMAKDLVYPVKKLMVAVNGVPLFGSDGLQINKQDKSEIMIPLNVPLSAGKNQIVISAINTEGTESLQQSVNIVRSGVVSKPDLYIIAIGSGEFSESQNNLKYAVKDAHDVISLFKERAPVFNQVIVDTLFDRQVTMKNINRLKLRLLQSHPDDLVIVYFSGHGILDEQLNYYLSAYQVNFTDPSKNGIPYEKMQRLLDSIPARNKLMLVDACFTGELDKSVSRDAGNNKANAVIKNGANPPVVTSAAQQEKIFQLMQTFFSDLRKSNGTSEIGAAGPAEKAREVDELRNGVFTFFLKKGLHGKEADINKDGKISVSELADYLKDSVAGYTEKLQKPTLRSQNIVNDLIIWN